MVLTDKPYPKNNILYVYALKTSSVKKDIDARGKMKCYRKDYFLIYSN